MAGLWEHQRVKTPTVVSAKTGGSVDVNEDEYRDQFCDYCAEVTHTYAALWEHRWIEHNISWNNIYRFGVSVEEMKSRATKPGSTHYIVCVVRCAYGLGLFGEVDYEDEDVQIVGFLDNIGKCINSQAENDPYQKTLLKVVAAHFIEKYGDSIWENWDLVNSGKMEIKEEVDIKEEEEDSSHADDFINEQDSMTVDDEFENDVFQSGDFLWMN